jgi:hypothetical protein
MNRIGVHAEVGRPGGNVRARARSRLRLASAALSRCVAKVVGYPPLCETSGLQRRELQEALLDADSFEEMPGKWQAESLQAEENRPNLSTVDDA